MGLGKLAEQRTGNHTIGAMDLLYSGFKHFCLVTGDRDYVPLVRRLRQDHCTVVVIGTERASAALKEVASQFLTTDQLMPDATPPSKPRAKGATLQPTELPGLLSEAYRVARQALALTQPSTSLLFFASVDPS